MQYRFLLASLSILFTISLTAQKQIEISDIWKDYIFSARGVAGFNFMDDGNYYTLLANDNIEKFNFETGEKVETLLNGRSIKNQLRIESDIDAYNFSEDESQVLLSFESEAIYRRSSKGYFYVYNFSTRNLSKVSEEKISFASFSPDGLKVAFVESNNLFYKNLKSGQLTQITFDGKHNEVINGMADWVYEEEFVITKTFEWSNDSKSLAFIKFDESEVRMYTLEYFRNGMYPEPYTFKYPKVGEANAKVSVHVFSITRGKTTVIDVGNLDDMYIPRIQWTNDSNLLCITKLNRHQNHLQLLLTDVKKNRSTVMLDEVNKYYIDVTNSLTFLKDGKNFIWTSEEEGYNQVYIKAIDGNMSRNITPGNYDVISFYGVDEKNKKIYFKAAKESPMDHQIFEIDLNGKDLKCLTPALGIHNADFSATFDMFVDNHSTINTPPTYNVLSREGKQIRSIEENTTVKNRQLEFGTSNVEFLSITTEDDVELNAWMIKPADFDPAKKYPLFMTQYSGPNSQSVTNSWIGINYWWYQKLAQEGYIIVCVDPRGTGARGEEFRKMTYMQLGHYETIDQIASAKYFGDLDYIDKNRIGIYGWSYGGYMSSLCMLKGADVFKAGIAVAPVTNWKWYDSVYTERYMRTYLENKEGYDKNSPIHFADKLEDPFLIIHGMADDNVHFQNSIEMASALIEADKQYDTYFYPNKNHGIFGGNTRNHLFQKMTNFVLENL